MVEDGRSREGKAHGQRGSETLAAFGYPQVFSDLLNTLADRVQAVQHVTSVLLVGSTSRGEAGVRVVDGRLEVLGDVEFTIATNSGRASYSAVSSAITAVKAEWAGHLARPIQIDFTLIPSRRLRRTIDWYEGTKVRELAGATPVGRLTE